MTVMWFIFIVSINSIVCFEFIIPYGANPINLYSPEFTVKPKK
jgi:hypothetical protein